MALTLDATVGGAAATSYVDLAWALEYFENLLSYPRWAAIADDDTRKRALNTATNLLDRLKFWGTRKTTEQALEFPRVYLPTSDGLTIPRAVQVATVEFALVLAEQLAEEQGGGQSPNAKLRQDGVTRYKLGDYEIQFGQGGSAGLFAVLPPPVQSLIGSWVKKGSKIVSGRCKADDIFPADLPWALQ